MEIVVDFHEIKDMSAEQCERYIESKLKVSRLLGCDGDTKIKIDHINHFGNSQIQEMQAFTNYDNIFFKVRYTHDYIAVVPEFVRNIYITQKHANNIQSLKIYGEPRVIHIDTQSAGIRPRINEIEANGSLIGLCWVASGNIVHGLNGYTWRTVKLDSEQRLYRTTLLGKRDIPMIDDDTISIRSLAGYNASNPTLLTQLSKPLAEHGFISFDKLRDALSIGLVKADDKIHLNIMTEYEQISFDADSIPEINELMQEFRRRAIQVARFIGYDIDE